MSRNKTNLDKLMQYDFNNLTEEDIIFYNKVEEVLKKETPLIINCGWEN